MIALLRRRRCRSRRDFDGTSARCIGLRNHAGPHVGFVGYADGRSWPNLGERNSSTMTVPYVVCPECGTRVRATMA